MRRPGLTTPGRTRLSVVWLVVLVMAASSSCGLAASDAEASSRQLTYFDASAQLLNPHTRTHSARQLAHLGVKAIRLELSWSSVAPAPNSAHTPRADLGAASSYAWGNYDAV